MRHAVKTSRPRYGEIQLLALVAMLSIPARVVASDPRSGFSEQLDLVAVEVELVVTGPRGRPVIDLERADLELYHDGARREILYLDRPANPPVATGGEARRRQLIVYADNLRIWPKRRNAMLRRLSGFIDQRLSRGDRVSVVAFDGSVELLAVDSRDIGRLRGALATLASRPTAMPRIAGEARQLRQALADGVNATALEPRIERYVERLHLDARRSLAGLAATLQAIAQPAQSTSILYLSDGIPAWPGDQLPDPGSGDAGSPVVIRLRPGVGDADPQAVPTRTAQYLVTLPRSPAPRLAPGIEGTARFLEPLIRIAGTRDVAFYPVRPSAFIHPTILGSRFGAASRTGHIETLRRLAHSTGGDLVPFGGFEAALARLSRRLDSAYVLGFQVFPQTDRAPHALEVQLARKGLKAHYRRTLDLHQARSATILTPSR